MAGRDWSNIVYSDAYLLASWSSFKSTNRFQSREETGDLPSSPYPMNLRPTTSSHFVCDLRMKGHLFLGVYLRYAISDHPFRCPLHNSPLSPYPFPHFPDGLSCWMPFCWCAAQVKWFLHNLFQYLILLTRTVTMFSCISVSFEYR
jgi:hypothetical protein